MPEQKAATPEPTATLSRMAFDGEQQLEATLAILRMLIEAHRDEGDYQYALKGIATLLAPVQDHLHDLVWGLCHKTPAEVQP